MLLPQTNTKILMVFAAQSFNGPFSFQSIVVTPILVQQGKVSLGHSAFTYGIKISG